MKKKIKNGMLLFTVLSVAGSIVNAQGISRVTLQPMKVVYIIDSVLAADSFSVKMGKDYGLLFSLIGQQQLKPGKIMGIYYTAAPPFIFDVAVEVDREPDQLAGAVQFKTIEGGDAVVVHFKGPYEQIEKAYLQIEDWLKKNNKQRAGSPIEVYLNDPATVKDKNELLTDVYQLIK